MRCPQLTAAAPPGVEASRGRVPLAAGAEKLGADGLMVLPRFWDPAMAGRWEKARAPRRPLVGAEREEVLRIIPTAIATRPTAAKR